TPLLGSISITFCEDSIGTPCVIAGLVAVLTTCTSVAAIARAFGTAKNPAPAMHAVISSLVFVVMCLVCNHVSHQVEAEIVDVTAPNRAGSCRKEIPRRHVEPNGLRNHVIVDGAAAHGAAIGQGEFKVQTSLGSLRVIARHGHRQTWP